MVAPAHLFETGVFASKFLILGLLLWLAYLTKYTEFVTANPELYLSECILMGGATALSVLVIAFCRMQPAGKCLNVALLGFLVFFVFQTLLEFSGLNQAGTVGMEAEAKAVLDANTKWLLIPLGIIFAGLGILSLWVRDGTGFKTGRVGGWPQLVFEAIILGIGAAVPTMMVAIDRGATLKDALPGVVEGGVMFAALHCILQAGGFYSHAFPQVSAGSA
jgi:hypothetical protein